MPWQRRSSTLAARSPTACRPRRSFNGPITQTGDHVAIDEQGSIWLAGIFDQPFQAGDQLLTPEGYDIYLIRLCP